LTLTRNDFELVAKTLSEARERYTDNLHRSGDDPAAGLQALDVAIEGFADLFAGHYTRFNRERFLMAAEHGPSIDLMNKIVANLDAELAERKEGKVT